MTWIFINYRRHDSRLHSKLIYDSLMSEYRKQIFFDHESILGGDYWIRNIQQSLKASQIVLVVIGPQWLKIAKQRSEAHKASKDDIDKRDWVIHEIEEAIAQRKRIIPVLVENAQLPSK